MSAEFQVSGTNTAALFSLKLHRGDGMTLVAMNWKTGTPPKDFVGFAIEYKEPGGDKFFSLKNRLAFSGANEEVNPNKLSTRLSPIQKFRWVHFPRNAELAGEFVYQVTPVFMNEADELSYGESQQAAIELRRETYPGVLNVTFTRGFVSSQAFVDRYGKDAIKTLLPLTADKGLDFTPTHPKADEALAWMGFEARSAILEVLDQAIADQTAAVRVVAYDLNEPEIVSRLEKLGSRLKVIIDDEGSHGKATSSETKAAKRLAVSAGAANVKRQHLGQLQHNKTIVVDGKVQAAVCGSTNFSWRGIFVQNNNAIILRGKSAVKIFLTAFDDYWASATAAAFGKTGSAAWNDLGLTSIDAEIGFSPRAKKNAVLTTIADDISRNTTSSLFYSLAFLYQTKGAIRNAFIKHQKDDDIFSYGISDRPVAGLDLQKPDGKVRIVRPEVLEANIPQPFKAEPTGGGGLRLHHKLSSSTSTDPPREFIWAPSISRRRRIPRMARTYCSFETAASPSPTSSRHSASSTTMSFAWLSWIRRKPKRNFSSPSRRGRPVKKPGGRRITRTPGKSRIANSSRRPLGSQTVRWEWPNVGRRGSFAVDKPRQRKDPTSQSDRVRCLGRPQIREALTNRGSREAAP